MTQDGGKILEKQPGAGLLRDVQQADSVSRGFDRGVISTLPLEDVAIGIDMYLAVVDVGHLPFILNGLAIQARDAALGKITVGLYNIEDSTMTSKSWLARLADAVTMTVDGTPREYMGVLANRKEIDRTGGVYMVAALSSSLSMVIRGTLGFTPPCFAGWKLPAPGSMPKTVSNNDVTYSLLVPSIGMMTQAGTRLRGTGTIPP